MLVVRRLNCTDAASGIVTLIKWLSGAQVERDFSLSMCIGAHVEREFSLNMCIGQPLTESDDTRCCISTIHPPDVEHIMLEICRGS